MRSQPNFPHDNILPARPSSDGSLIRQIKSNVSKLLIVDQSHSKAVYAQNHRVPKNACWAQRSACGNRRPGLAACALATRCTYADWKFVTTHDYHNPFSRWLKRSFRRSDFSEVGAAGLVRDARQEPSRIVQSASHLARYRQCRRSGVLRSYHQRASIYRRRL